MSSTNRRKLRLNTVAVSLGCSCRRPSLSSIFCPKPKSHSNKNPTTLYQYSSPPTPTPWDNFQPHHYPYQYHQYYDTTPTATATTFSPAESEEDSSSSDVKSLRAVQGFGRIGGESVAVEKESDDPYLDFRRSMLQMILEKEIYSKNDLRELLNCFLQLNSPYYHGLIVRAFTEIWNGVFSSTSSVKSSSPLLRPHLVGRRKSRAF